MLETLTDSLFRHIMLLDSLLKSILGILYYYSHQSGGIISKHWLTDILVFSNNLYIIGTISTHTFASSWRSKDNYIIHFTYQWDLHLPVFDTCIWIDAVFFVCYPEFQSQTLLQRRRKQKCWLPSVHLQFKQTRTTLAICTLRQFQTDMFNIRPASQWE